MELGHIQFDDVVVVAGCGPLGLGMVAAARQKNPKLLVALDMLDWKVCVCVCHCNSKTTVLIVRNMVYVDDSILHEELGWAHCCTVIHAYLYTVA